MGTEDITQSENKTSKRKNRDLKQKKKSLEKEMKALEQLLGKDVVWLIYQKLHLVCTSEVVAEYHGRLSPVFLNCPYICLRWKIDEKSETIAYNYRGVLDGIMRGNVLSKNRQLVGALPKNY